MKSIIAAGKVVIYGLQCSIFDLLHGRILYIMEHKVMNHFGKGTTELSSAVPNGKPSGPEFSKAR